MRKVHLLVCIGLLLASFGMASGQETLTISFWGNVQEYAAGGSDNAAWEASYNLINEWAAEKGVTVEFISQPIDGIYDRIRTQLISGTLPDVVAMYPSNSFLQGNLDLLVDLTPYMSQPNPYGSFATWGEEFWYDQKVGLRDTAIPAGQVYFVGNSLPTNIGQLVIFYNNDIFTEQGLSVPTSLTELLATCDTLTAAGITPMFNDGTGPFFGWYTLPIVESLYAPISTTILDAWGVADAPFAVTSEMLAWAVQNGVLSGSNDYVLEGARIMNELATRCWNSDWQSPDASVDYFLTGRTAMTINGFWMLGLYGGSDEMTFDYGTFAFPTIDTASSPLATLPFARRWGGVEGGEIGNSYMIPATTAASGRLELAIDLLQYLTARSTNDQWCASQPMPCIPPDESVTEVVTDPVAQRELFGFYNPTMSNDLAIRGIGDPTPDGVLNRLFMTYNSDTITL
ncbi:MAG: ABC transporter substrate-binding protein, partial [Anaerolineae bacterium]|nr:ABC transporter substrate-binding protein [Anaerolineae bacterium]